MASSSSKPDHASKDMKTDGSSTLSAAEKSKGNRKICLKRLPKHNDKSMVTGRIKLPDMLVEQSWLEALPDEFQKSYALALCMFVGNEYFAFKDSVYPPPHLIFDAFNTTPFHSVKALILGQEPYSGPGQAMGLSLSVPRGIQFPSTLKNVLKEVKNDLDCKVLRHGNLEKWALQGVLLLNAVLTGRINENNANAHANIGWEQFTDAVIKTISEKKEGLVFLLWGEYAQEKIQYCH